MKKQFKLSSLSKDLQTQIKKELAAEKTLNYSELQELLEACWEEELVTTKEVEEFKANLATMFDLCDKFKDTLEYHRLGTLLYNFGEIKSALIAVKGSLEYASQKGTSLDEHTRDRVEGYLQTAFIGLKSLLR